MQFGIPTTNSGGFQDAHILVLIHTQVMKKGAKAPSVFQADSRIYTAKDEPQPQVVAALGLRITNWEPCNPSV